MRAPLLLAASLGFVLAGLSAGCTLYIEPDPDDSTEPGRPPVGDPSDPTGPGWACDSNDDCAAGCFCGDDGTCIEAGFCSSTDDCPRGYVCDDRSSCVPGDPEEPPPSCEDIADETACLAREDCGATYNGIGCESSDGSSCTGDMPNCTCESFVFAGCVSLPAGA